jgi:hypothetical protein
MYQRTSYNTSDKGPYGLEITNPSATITRIECCPIADQNIQSPEVILKSGGINYRHVRIYLVPTVKDKWAYQLAITAEEDETKASQQVRIE